LGFIIKKEGGAMKEISLVEVLESVFYFFPDDTFVNDRETIHSAFFKLRNKYQNVLKDLPFRKNILFPRSRALDEILSSLQPDFLKKYNPTYDTYNIKKENLETLWENELKSILGKHEGDLKEIASELHSLLEEA